MEITPLKSFFNSRSAETQLIKRPKFEENTSELLKGHAMMSSMRIHLSHFDEQNFYSRSRDQVQIHQKMLSCMCKVIYGPSTFQRNKKEIQQVNGFKEVQNFLACMLPRRQGKSISMAQFIVCCLLVVKGVNIVLVVNNNKNAENITSKVREFLKFFKVSPSSLPTDNKKQIVYIHPDGSESKFMSFSGQGKADK